MFVKEVDAERLRRRLRLRVLLKCMIAFACVVIVLVLLSAFLSDDGEEGNLPGQRIAIADMLPGETRILTWDGRAVLVHRRTSDQQRQLADAEGVLARQLRDPESAESVQPDALRNSYRSSDREWFVAIGLGTDYGCPIRWQPAEENDFAGAPWTGGFVDTCRGSRYDLAGRVYARQYADRNLVIPDYRLGDGVLILGG